MEHEIRQAVPADLPGILEIYNDVVATSTAIYSLSPSTLEDRRDWFEARKRAGFPVIVCHSADQVLGFASFAEFRGAWAGYRYSVEHSVHIRADVRGRGLGRDLLQALLPIARQMGKHVMIGAIDAENVASLRLHERLGFQRVGHFREVGNKFDRWLDLVFVQRFV